jgi:hypothetical protein
MCKVSPRRPSRRPGIIGVFLALRRVDGRFPMLIRHDFAVGRLAEMLSNERSRGVWPPGGGRSPVPAADLAEPPPLV